MFVNKSISPLKRFLISPTISTLHLCLDSSMHRGNLKFCSLDISQKDGKPTTHSVAFEIKGFPFIKVFHAKNLGTYSKRINAELIVSHKTTWFSSRSFLHLHSCPVAESYCHGHNDDVERIILQLNLAFMDTMTMSYVLFN